MTPFSYPDYKAFLKIQAEESRGNLTKLAGYAGCQASYLLRVIHEEAELTLDQAFKLCSYWNFSDPERDYFMTQINLSRAADPSHREFLQKRLDQLLSAHTNLKEVVKRQEISDVQLLLEYHSDPRVSILHFLMACRPFQNVESLAKRMNMSLEEVREMQTFLEERGLALREGKEVKFKTGAGHISKGSAVLPTFFTNWRQMAVQKSLRTNDKSVHFTNLQTIGLKDIAKLSELARHFIREAKALCDASGSEEVVAVNLDVFIP